MSRKKKPLELTGEELEDLGLVNVGTYTNREAFKILNGTGEVLMRGASAVEFDRLCAEQSESSVIAQVAATLSDEEAEQLHEIVESHKPKFELSDEQKEAKRLILEWLDTSKDELRIGGYAGVGKTELLRHVIQDIKDHTSVSVSAFTAKACSVLRRKGMYQAQTLHSLLYKPEYDSIRKKMTWIKRTVLPSDLVIVDEASMVSTELYNDLKAHDVKLLFIGDPAQLEPVGDNPNLMRETDFTMTQIHRQAQNSPILRLAKAVREGRTDLPLGEWGDDERGHVKITNSMRGINLEDYDIVICARNVTRHGINERRRNQLGRIGDPVVGESVMCLKNDKEKGVFNGMILTVKSISGIYTVGGKLSVVADLTDEVGDTYYDIPMRLESFGRDKSKEYDRSASLPFDYAYGCTAWKFQGSEAEKVLFLNEPLFKVDWSRFAYTAITRASKSLTIVNMI